MTTEAPATLDRTWGTASTAAADGTTAAANGWCTFDGTTATYTDTTTKSCNDTVLPTDGTVFEILAQVTPAVERRLPRDRHADPRLQRQRSDLDDVRDHRHPLRGLEHADPDRARRL
ncbi:hypothetical protein [Glycomyces artemisiae]|uniref:Uncharacterized protein n=1 Tax=Glycomyces artemisiae TaxID=1076443 RepID=A0A2T0UFF4_9ACTN|nr:hypothetical protein [Glycomyces artemisiae]PRY56604.1 hypothetical protein B0I28_109253 [Glycomyces artemisiae]